MSCIGFPVLSTHMSLKFKQRLQTGSQNQLPHISSKQKQHHLISNVLMSLHKKRLLQKNHAQSSVLNLTQLTRVHSQSESSF